MNVRAFLSTLVVVAAIVLFARYAAVTDLSVSINQRNLAVIMEVQAKNTPIQSDIIAMDYIHEIFTLSSVMFSVDNVSNTFFATVATVEYVDIGDKPSRLWAQFGI